MRLPAGALIAALFCLGAGTANAFSPEEARAATTLRTRLMIAALKCKDETLYNPVVIHHKRLFDQAEILLRRSNGGRHDRWVTQIANLQSERTNGQGEEICQEARQLGDALLATPSTPKAFWELAKRQEITWPKP